MTWAELRPAFAKRRYPCAERASAHGLIARNNQSSVVSAAGIIGSSFCTLPADQIAGTFPLVRQITEFSFD